MPIKKSIIIFIVVFFYAKVSAFCFYNNSKKYPKIVVFGFKNKNDYDKFTKANGWTKKVSSAITVLATEPENDKEYDKAADDIEKDELPIIKDVTKVHSDVYDMTWVPFKKTIPTGGSACWNKNDILKDLKVNTMYFLVTDEKGHALWYDHADIAWGIVYTDAGVNFYFKNKLIKKGTGADLRRLSDRLRAKVGKPRKPRAAGQ